MFVAMGYELVGMLYVHERTLDVHISLLVRIARSVVALLSFVLLPSGSLFDARIDTFHCMFFV
jgi:hypothetical protein